MLHLVAFWLVYVLHATAIVTSGTATFYLRLTWLGLTATSLYILHRSQPTLAYSSREQAVNFLWTCSLLLSFACLLDVHYWIRVFVFFAYSSVQTWCVIYFLAARSVLSLRP